MLDCSSETRAALSLFAELPFLAVEGHGLFGNSELGSDDQRPEILRFTTF
jgi:hypothetical protein